MRKRNCNSKGRQKRYVLSDYFMGEGTVEWKLRIVNFQSTAVVGDFDEDEQQDLVNVFI